MRGLRREKKPITMAAMKELTDFYTERFVEDLTALNIKQPHHLPKASEHVAEDIALITTLLDKGYVYQISDGLYFDTSKDEDYGKLQKRVELSEDLQTRIGDNSEKRNQRDFAVWKFSDSGSQIGDVATLGFQSPWGLGWPGWHIECSAMSMKYLGETFDIHTGGIDHIPVHHTNEIAQSECATGHELAHYWMHTAFVIINSEKMAKSTGNYFTLKGLIENGVEPLAYRYWLLTAHYRTQVNFTLEAVLAAQTAYKKLLAQIATLPVADVTAHEGYLHQFSEFIADDIDTAKSIALIWDLLKDATVSPEQKRATIAKIDSVLGLKLTTQTTVEIPEEIKELLDERALARTNKDWKKSDELRDAMKHKGFEVKDMADGQHVIKG